MTLPDLQHLRARAETGDARAQYMLAGALSAMGRREEADQWLCSAAELGEPDASYTLATRELQKIAGAKDAAEKLQDAAEKGSSAAKRLLAVLYAEGLGVSNDRRRAIELVIEAAKMGDPAAMREIAMLLFLLDENDPSAASLLKASAEQDAIAAAVFVHRAAERRKSTNSELARVLMDKLSAAKYPNAGSLMQMLGAAPQQNSVGENTPHNWADIYDRLLLNWESPAPAEKALCDAPHAVVYRDVFSPEECEYVIAAAAMRLSPSQTFDPRTGQSRQDAYRTSMTATLGPVDLDLALVKVNHRMAALAGRAPENGEFLSVLHYAPGQEYKPHADWLPPGEDFDRGGQRVATALLYLNDDYEGGETRFLAPDIQFKGRPGDVLVFRNVLPDGEPDHASRHASLPVTRGAKWLGSKWFREKKYNF